MILAKPVCRPGEWLPFRCLRQLRPKAQLGWRQNIDIGVEWNGESPLGSLLVTARESVVMLAIVP
jgi:hypothetical protein